MIDVKLEKVLERQGFMKYLLLADEDEEIVEQYIDDGDLYQIIANGVTAGVCLFTFPDEDVVEIKNIALESTFRGSGIGTRVLHLACDFFKKEKYTTMIVGTANSSIDNLAFYQKAGFRFKEIKKDFFLSYPAPIYENGIQAYDMIVFDKVLDVR